MTKFDIIIPTHQRPDLLKRTLATIAHATLPSSLQRIIVVENGGRSGAQVVCKQFAQRLPVSYLYAQEPGAPNARNIAAGHSSSDILLFIDDDIRVLPDTLNAYHEAFQRHGPSCFFGGPLTPDYEHPPEPFLIEFLPWSAKGHSLGDQEKQVSDALFLCGNMAVPREIFFEYGGFDQVGATGSDGGGVGEETRLQTVLIASGVPGIYVPGALVGHYVPSNRCSKAFVKRRHWRTGFGEGQLAAMRDQRPADTTCFSVPCWKWKLLAIGVGRLVASYLTFKPKGERFKRALAIHSLVGNIAGYRTEARHRKG